MSLPRYSQYKNSDAAAWLGELPAHWKLQRVKRLVNSIEQGWSPQCENFAVDGADEWGVLKVGCVNGGVFNPLENKKLPSELMPIPELSITEGDLLISRANTRELVGSAAVAKKSYGNLLLCDKLYRLRLRSEQCLPHFLSFYLGIEEVRNQIALAATGASSSMLNIGQSVILELPVPLPPFNEQCSITAFVDHETGKIDTLIAEQKKLLTLLTEKRRATISHAVTRGLDANTSMKDSGVAWLGKVPAHWEILRLGQIFREVAESGDDLLPILSVSIHDGVSDKELNDNELERKVTRSDDRSKYKKVVCGDLVYNMMRAWQGGFGTVETTGMVSPAYVVARPVGNDFLTNFVEQLLRTPQGVQEMKRYSRGITDFRLRLYWDEFKCIKIPLPPLLEQEKIMASVSETAGYIDRLSEQATSAIELLQERRSALIAAAVTGKIDVRDAVPQELAA